MMPSCDWHQNYVHKFPKCFRLLHTLLGLSFCVPRYQFTCCQCTKLIHFLTCTRIPCRGSHCENGRVRCCICMSANWAENLGREKSRVCAISQSSVLAALCILCWRNHAEAPEQFSRNTKLCASIKMNAMERCGTNSSHAAETA